MCILAGVSTHIAYDLGMCTVTTSGMRMEVEAATASLMWLSNTSVSKVIIVIDQRGIGFSVDLLSLS